MQYINAKPSLGLTAIAAVLALSSTPLAAQDVTATEPTTEATSSVPADAPTTVADPLAPAPAAEPTVTATTTPATEPTAEAKPARSRTTAARPTAPRRAPVRIAATAPSPAEPATPVAPAPEQPAVEQPAAPTDNQVLAMMDEPAPMPVEDTATGLESDEMLAAGAAGLGILALAGAGLAVRRRRRRAEENAWAEPVRHEPVAAEPRFVRPEPVAVAPVAAAMPAVVDGKVEAPAGSSPRTRAAYAGPTQDNPSLSLKKRLKRARALDQMERRHALPEARPVRHTEPARPASQPAFAFRRTNTNEPAFQY